MDGWVIQVQWENKCYILVVYRIKTGIGNAYVCR